MRGEEYDRWCARNLRENTGYTLKVGDRIMDRWWTKGAVTQIVIWDGEPSVENHGAVNVLLDSGEEEHYVWFGWETNFRVERS